MDNDLMARRLRPPSQPTPANGQQPAQASSPWDVPLADGQIAPPDGQLPPQDPQFAPQDPPFAPPDGQWGPDPQARADVPWDRPDPEPWPPADDEAADVPQTWSAQGGVPAAPTPQPDWPVADSLEGEAAPPWDRPTANEADESHDPYDAMAPVVSDVIQTPAGAWEGWNGNGHHATPGAPEPMKVAAHSDGPLDSDESRAVPWSEPASTPSPPTSGSAPGAGNVGGPDPVPDWPAEDDLTVTPPTSRGPVMPEDSWPVTPPVAPPVAPAVAPTPADPALAAVRELKPEPEPAEPEAPVAPQTTPEPAAAPTVSAMVMPSGANPQNMVLRIEVAIVDESRRANPADAAKRVGPDADVRRPEYEPRNHGGRASMPEPEYLWDAPPGAPDQPQQRRPRYPAPANAQPAAPARRVSPPPSAWHPAAPVVPQPTSIDWELPAVGAAQPMVDPPAPWLTPAPAQSPYQQPAQAPAPTWALTQPTPPYQPPAPLYQPPAPQPPATPQYPAAYPPQPYPPQAYQPAPQDYHTTPQEYQPAPPQYQPPAPQPSAWPPAQPIGPAHDPLAGLPAAPYVAPSPYAPAPYAPIAPTPATPQQMPVQSFQSAPAAGSRARTGQVAADQADLWFLSNQPAATTLADDDAQPEGRSSSILTAALTIGFALLVIFLVLVFIQFMTSLLR